MRVDLRTCVVCSGLYPSLSSKTLTSFAESLGIERNSYVVLCVRCLVPTARFLMDWQLRYLGELFGASSLIYVQTLWFELIYISDDVA